MPITRRTLHRLVDALAFAAFVLVAATGLLLHTRLLPGSGGLQGQGTGHQAAAKPIALLWGLTRHGWGEVHFWVGASLLSLLLLHVFLHWRWIVCAVRGQPRQGSGIRVTLGIVAFVLLIAFGITPFLSPTSRVARGQLSESTTSSATTSPPAVGSTGAMTLRDMAYILNMPAATLLQQLGLPQDVSPDDPLPRLYRHYGISLDDLRRVAATRQ